RTTMDAPSAPRITEALGTNDRGQIVGACTNASGDHGFLLSGGVYTTLDDSAGMQAHDTQAIGINNAGQIVGTFQNASGTHGFLLSGGVYTTLAAPFATHGTVATAINNPGQLLCLYVGSSAHA